MPHCGQGVGELAEGAAGITPQAPFIRLVSFTARLKHAHALGKLSHRWEEVLTAQRNPAPSLS